MISVMVFTEIVFTSARGAAVISVAEVGYRVSKLRVGMPKIFQLETMSAEKLWTLYETIRMVLTTKMKAQQLEIERRLQDLDHSGIVTLASTKSGADRVDKMSARRPYPKVVPIYRNPVEPSETWSGRGKRPRWLAGQIADGKSLEQFRISSPPNRAGKHGPKRK